MVLVNNTVLSNFAKVNRLDLLKRAFEKLYVTEQVLEEFKLGVEKNLISKEEGNQILKEMIVKGFYSPISDLNEIV